MANANTIMTPLLNAAHRHSMDNRSVIEAGGACACFHCLKAFDAQAVVQWGGSDTALCPFCHYDTVLSSKVDPIDDNFLRQMKKHFFGRTSPLDLTDELAKLGVTVGAGEPR